MTVEPFNQQTEEAINDALLNKDLVYCESLNQAFECLELIKKETK